MTEIEKKSEKYAKQKEKITGSFPYGIKTAYKDGYKQGQKDTFQTYDSELTNISDNYSQRLKQLQKEHEELKQQIEKMKNMQNCKHNWETKGQCVLNNGGYCICNNWELAK